jgi:hypothetical protein
VLDITALVIGAAVASVHLRHLIEPGLTAAGWGMVWVTFAGVAISAAGPFVVLVRGVLLRLPGYPRTGDSLWCLLGLPWVLSGLLRLAWDDGPASGGLRRGVGETGADASAALLWIGLGAASVVAMGTVWRTWVLASPAQIQARQSAWTDRVGLVLSVAWPMQFGFGLVVVG